MWHIFYFIINRASLFFAFFFLFYFTSRNSRYENLQVTIMKKLKLLRCPKTKRSRYGLRKKYIYPRFPCFRFCPIPKIENSEISEICLFLQILTVVINQDLKTTKIWTERKIERLRYDLKEKMKISEVSEFSILLYTHNRKLRNLGKFYFSSIWNFYF